MRKANVYYRNTIAGELIENEDGYTFRYLTDLQFVCRIRPAQRSSRNQRQRGTRPLSRRQKMASAACDAGACLFIKQHYYSIGQKISSSAAQTKEKRKKVLEKILK